MQLLAAVPVPVAQRASSPEFVSSSAKPSQAEETEPAILSLQGAFREVMQVKARLLKQLQVGLPNKKQAGKRRTNEYELAATLPTASRGRIFCGRICILKVTGADRRRGRGSQDAESNFRTLLVEMVRGSDPRWGDWWPRLQKDVQGRATNPALARPEAEALFRDHVVHLAASAEKGGGPAPLPARPCAEMRPPHDCGSHMSSQTEWHAVLTGHRSDHVCGNEVLFVDISIRYLLGGVK